MDNQPNQLLSLIRELTNNSQRIAAIEVEKYDLDREKRRCEQLVAEDSKVIFGKLTPIVERYFGISGYKITHIKLRENHHGRNHIVIHSTDDLNHSKNPLLLPIEVLNWNNEQWKEHLSAHALSNKLRDEKIKSAILSLEEKIKKLREQLSDDDES